MNTAVKYSLYLVLFIFALTIITAVFSFLDIDFTILYPYLLWIFVIIIFFLTLPKKAGILF